MGLLILFLPSHHKSGSLNWSTEQKMYIHMLVQWIKCSIHSCCKPNKLRNERRYSQSMKHCYRSVRYDLDSSLRGCSGSHPPEIFQLLCSVLYDTSSAACRRARTIFGSTLCACAKVSTWFPVRSQQDSFSWLRASFIARVPALGYDLAHISTCNSIYPLCLSAVDYGLHR